MQVGEIVTVNVPEFSVSGRVHEQTVRAACQRDGVKIPILHPVHAEFGPQVRDVTQVRHVDEKGASALAQGVERIAFFNCGRFLEPGGDAVIAGTCPGTDQYNLLPGAGRELPL